jgi:hypothetical protein
MDADPDVDPLDNWLLLIDDVDMVEARFPLVEARLCARRGVAHKGVCQPCHGQRAPLSGRGRMTHPTTLPP